MESEGTQRDKPGFDEVRPVANDLPTEVDLVARVIVVVLVHVLMYERIVTGQGHSEDVVYSEP